MRIFVILTIISLAFSQEKEFPTWTSYGKIGVGELNGPGGVGFIRLKRVNKNTFNDIRFLSIIQSKSSFITARYKSSNKIEVFPFIYRFTVTSLRRNSVSGLNIRYHYNQGFGAFIFDKANNHLTSEIAFSYDMSDYLNDTRKTSYLKYGFFWDINFSKIFMNLDFEYFSQISDLLPNEVLSNRYEVSSKINYQLNKFLNVTFGIEYEKYIFKEFIINKNETYNSFYLGIGFKEILEWKL